MSGQHHKMPAMTTMMAMRIQMRMGQSLRSRLVSPIEMIGYSG